MKYLFDMGEVWHVYSDVGKQWIYQRLERVNEEILDKNGDNLPGPLGKLDILKQLEGERDGLRRQLEQKEQEWKAALEETCKVREEAQRAREAAAAEALQIRSQLEFEIREAEKEVVKLQQELEREKMTAKEEIGKVRERFGQESMEAMTRQKSDFERSYRELQTMAEELQKEGKLWRQRYLDLAYQVSPKN